MEIPHRKKLYLIRHGETDPNKNHIIQGSGLNAPLNETGRRQADNFFRAYHHIPFQAIYTSALIRTKQSVQPFLDKGIPHVVMAELNEISWGDKDGTRIDPEEQIFYQSLLNDWRAGLLDRHFPNGESPRQVEKRMRRAMAEIMAKENEETILMAIHGRAMRILLCILLEKPLNLMEDFIHSNLCLYVLSWDGNRWQLELSNDTSHLRF